MQDIFKKNICMFVLNSCTNDARVIKEATTLGKAGYDVRIIAVVSDNARATEEKREYFTIHRIKPGSFPPAFHKFPGFFKKISNRSDKIILYLSYWLKAKRLAEGFKSDIYHAHDLNTLLPAFLAAKKTKARIIYDSHELFTCLQRLNIIEKYFFIILEKLLIRRADGVITINRSIADELVKRYGIGYPAVIFNCPPPLDPASVPQPNDLLRRAAGVPDRGKIVLYQGGFDSNRGLEELIEAAGFLNDDYHFVFMGYGNLLNPLKSLADEKGLGHRVHFLPAVPQESLLAYSSSADIGVIPYKPVSLNNYYTLPNKLFEYINAGIPVAASDLPELRRIIKDYEAGLLFDPYKPKSIAEAIESVMSEKARYLKMKENTKIAAKKFNWENESKKLLEIYRLNNDQPFNLKILFAPNNIAGQMGVMSDALRDSGIYARSCSYKNKNTGHACDESLNLEDLTTVSAILEKLPPETRFPETLANIASYDKDNKILIFRKLMSLKHRTILLGLSGDPLYRKAVKQIFLKSVVNAFRAVARIGNFSMSAARRYDVFHFQAGQSLLPFNLDVPLLKKMNKKMVMQFRGSEVRQKSLHRNPYYPMQIREETSIRNMLKKLSKNIDAAVVSDYELYPYVKDYFRKIAVIPRAINLREYEEPFPSGDDGRPLIVHAPSNKQIKGTGYVLDAVERLSREYDFEFRLLHSMPHKDIKEIISKADIVIDQLLIGSYGNVSIEAMAMGKAVICYIREDLRNTFPEGLPIISANPDNIYEVLKELIADRDHCRELGKRGRPYVEQYHDAKKIAAQLINFYKSLC